MTHSKLNSSYKNLHGHLVAFRRLQRSSTVSTSDLKFYVLLKSIKTFSLINSNWFLSENSICTNLSREKYTIRNYLTFLLGHINKCLEVSTIFILTICVEKSMFESKILTCVERSIDNWHMKICTWVQHWLHFQPCARAWIKSVHIISCRIAIIVELFLSRAFYSFWSKPKIKEKIQNYQSRLYAI